MITLMRIVPVLSFLVSLSACAEDSLREAETPPDEPPRATVALGESDDAIVWGYHVFLLVNEKHVQEELALTSEQHAAISELAGKFLYQQVESRTRPTKRRPVRGPEKNAHAPDAAENSRNEGAANTQNSEQLAEAAADNRLQALSAFGMRAQRILEGRQRKRLNQVAFQLRSVEILYYPEVAERLKLTEKQKSGIAEIRKGVRREAGNLNEKYIQKGRNVKGFDEAVDQLFDESRSHALRLLTAEQKSLLEAMEGPKIDFARRHLDFTIRKAATKADDVSPGDA